MGQRVRGTGGKGTGALRTSRRPSGVFTLLPALALAAACGGDTPGEASRESPAATRSTPVESPDLAAAFAAEDAVGTLLIRRLSDGREWVHNAPRADSVFLPASTFKIPNAAIALEVGAVSGPDEAFPWDGVEREFEAWNRDHTLQTAMTASSVPVYQEVARRIGEARMAEWVERLDYGNADIGGGIDRFWLDGALRISAREQVDFLARLATGDLPLSPSTLEAVRTLVLLEDGPGGTLYGKTGWAFDVQVGWWAGWTRRDGDTWVFALNMAMPGISDAPKRVRIGRAALEAVGAVGAFTPSR